MASGASAKADRATRASTEPQERLGHSASVPSAATLRDRFAMAAMMGFLADGSQRKIADALEEHEDYALIQDPLAKASVINHEFAEGCYALADAMLFVRGAK